MSKLWRFASLFAVLAVMMALVAFQHSAPMTAGQMQGAVAGSACSFATGFAGIIGIASFGVPALAVPALVLGIGTLVLC